MIADVWRKVMDLLDAQERRSFYGLMALAVLSGAANMIGVGMVLPFLAVLTDPTVIERQEALAWLYTWLGFSDERAFLLFLGGLLLVFFLGSLAFRAFVAHLMFRFGAMRAYSIARRLMRSYLSQPYSFFLDRHSSDLIKSVTGEVNLVVGSVISPLLQAVANLAMLIALAVLLVIADPFVAGMMGLIIAVFYVLVLRWTRRKQAEAGRKRFESVAKSHRMVQDAMIGAKEIKVLGLEDTALRRFSLPTRHRAEADALNLTLAQLPRHLLEGVAFGGMLLVLLILLAQGATMQGILPLAGVYALAGVRMMPAAQILFAAISQFHYHRRALHALHTDVMAAERRPALELGPPPEPLRLREKMELREVVYTYPGSETPSLDRVSLEIKANSSVGVVGGTGAGKSTAMDIMLGLLSPQSGALAVDGQPIVEVAEMRAWRRAIGYVPQTIFLSDDSVAANIAFGLEKDDIDMEAVIRAARMAELHEFVTEQLPQGYHTLVGDRGLRLSGGQRQRVGIARALYHDPDLLIMDEATSALDNLTERAVIEAVERLGGRKTIIMVAHRLTTVERCDRIVMLERGKLVASGTYRELLETSPQFRLMATGED